MLDHRRRNRIALRWAIEDDVIDIPFDPRLDEGLLRRLGFFTPCGGDFAHGLTSLGVPAGDDLDIGPATRKAAILHVLAGGFNAEAVDLTNENR